MASEFEKQISELKQHLDKELEDLKTRFKQDQRARFERNVEELQETFRAGEERARKEVERGLAWAKNIQNPLLKEQYEKSIQLGLEIFLKSQKKMLADFIERWGG